MFHIPRNDLYRSSIGLLSWDHPLGTLPVYPRVSACRRCTETLHERIISEGTREKPNSLLTSRTNEQYALHDRPPPNGKQMSGPAKAERNPAHPISHAKVGLRSTVSARRAESIKGLSSLAVSKLTKFNANRAPRFQAQQTFRGLEDVEAL